MHFDRLKVGLQLQRQNPSIAQINAELKPDVKPGETILHVKVKEQHPFRPGSEISNRRPPSVGEGIGELYLANVNLTGHNDPLELRWGLARWTIYWGHPFVDFPGEKKQSLQDYGVHFSVSISAF